MLLDASGFSYTDQWGANYARKMADKLSRLKAEGKKIILLPQAFGPFENPEVKAAFETILAKSDLVFARDKVSYDYVKEFAGTENKLNLAPDFTNLITGRVPEYFTPQERCSAVLGVSPMSDTASFRGKVSSRDAGASAPFKKRSVCIIPNVRMLDKTSAEVRDKYLTFIANCIQCLFDLDLQPFIMVHQTGKDYEIALDLQKQFGDRLNVIAETNPLAIKGILGQCYAVISSRFHGIVSSLSQGVPCLATGWSHKYQMLFEDYRCPQLLMNPLFTPAEIKEKISAVTTKPSRTEIVATIEQAAKEQKELSKSMWKQVHQVIDLT